jgi:hypothetical protein
LPIWFVFTVLFCRIPLHLSSGLKIEPFTKLTQELGGVQWLSLKIVRSHCRADVHRQRFNVSLSPFRPNRSRIGAASELSARGMGR